MLKISSVVLEASICTWPNSTNYGSNQYVVVCVFSPTGNFWPTNSVENSVLQSGGWDFPSY